MKKILCVVTSNNVKLSNGKYLVTGQNPASAAGVGEAIVKLLA